MGANGFGGGLWRGTTAAKASLSIALASTAMEAPECFLSAIELSMTPFVGKKALGPSKWEGKSNTETTKG
jgi:hypothetical protein